MQHRRGRGLAPIDANRAAAEARICAFGGCGRTVSARGLCRAHYQQQGGGQPLVPLRSRRENGVIRQMVERGFVECLACGESKPLPEFSLPSASGVPRPYCKPCNAERVRLGKYRVTKEFVRRLSAFQQHCCAVCQSPYAGGRAPDIDHDHSCCPGRRSCGDCVRGLVCNDCNMHGLAWYEALPPGLRTFDLLNRYLADPPAKRLRAESALLGD
ncbi:endonuclease domain-containing protein [Streptomyces justiciae]|uniref:endonuclease domain-containing protein n=1 Tax=Streptomyces justiciae TaxID=2780140 RepID=UPI003908AF08